MSAWTRLWGVAGQRWRAESAANLAVAPPLFRRRRPSSAGTKVLFVNQYNWPDHASTAQHLTDLAESLVDQGYDVHVLCSKGSYKPGQAQRASREVRRGVTIHRVGATSFGRKSTIGRLTDYLSFYLRAMILALALPRFHVVATLTTPPIIGLIGSLLRQFKGARHVYWSMDLHPDASLALGQMSRRNPVVALLAWLSDAVYRTADRVVVLGPYMSDRLAAKGVRPKRLIPIPVWSRQEEIYPLPRENHPLREELGLSDKFVAMYSGNLGLAHSFEEFLEAARLLRHREDIVFLYVGDGPRMKQVRAAKEAEALPNVKIMDYFPREMLHASLSVGDVHLISMRPEMTGIVVPGKLYGAMASGRPVLFVGPDHCESADTIRQSECGFTARVGDAAAVVEAIELLASEPQLGESMGERGRSAFLEEHERFTCCERWADMLGALVEERTPVLTRPVRRPVSGRITHVS